MCTAFLVPLVITRGAPRQATWETAVSEGRNYGRKIADKFCRHLMSSTSNEGFFYMPQICDMEPTALLPLRRKASWGFFRPEKSDGFGRVWTRDLDHGIRLNPQERPGTHCIRDWVVPSAGLDGCGKSRPYTGIRSLDHPARSESLYRLSYPAPHKWTFLLHIHSSGILNSFIPFVKFSPCLHISPQSSFKHVFTLKWHAKQHSSAIYT
jgi:hypothetical protein